MKNRTILIRVVAGALLVKLFLFGFAEIYAPEAKFQADSKHYIGNAMTLVTEGRYARRDADSNLTSEHYWPPGYPLFLGLLHGLMKIPFSSVILLQICLTLLVAIICYRAARKIDHRLALISALIILFDPPITIFSLLILSETLFLALMAMFMYAFISYLGEKRISLLIFAAIALGLATYVRPISYYLGVTLSIFILYSWIFKNPKKALGHALIFFLVVYGLLAPWQYRNYKLFKSASFSGVEKSDLKNFGLMHSYSRNEDLLTQGMAPLPYYVSATSRCLLSLMTRPGTLKYFKSSRLKAVGKILSYPWVILWIIGFVAGLMKMHSRPEYQFMSLVVLYFVVTSIVGVLWLVGSRFRVPMMPFISILSANGWIWIASKIKK